MNIGNTIRTRRRAKDMTQENLAELLGVSVSAVSLWETEKTMPDITLIPALCSVLDISADELFSVNLERKTAEIDAIIEEASHSGDRGYTEEALAIIERGLAKYPDSDRLMNCALHYHYTLRSDTDHKAAAIAIGERMLEKCTKIGFRQSAIQKLCFIYSDENNERAEQLLDELGTLYTSREVIATHVYRGDKQIDHCQSLIVSALNIMTARMTKNVADDSGQKRYTRDELAQVNETVIALYHLIFADGDFGFYHTRLQNSEDMLADYYADRGDAKKALEHLRREAEHAIGFMEFAKCGEEEFVNTSLVLRGRREGGFSTTSTENNAAAVLRSMEKKRYDFVRDTPEFRAIRASLEAYPGDWEKLG
ncbi:MAG: helix-turn-helix transcriptional regulator [Clostridia bacterium]|nr:helix-turn-helix transcriptional regulator [Clostridia bacterium]